MIGNQCYSTYRNQQTGFQVVDNDGEVLYFQNYIVEMNNHKNPLVVKQVDNKTKKRMPD